MVFGEDHSQLLVPATLEDWSGGSSFQSMQVNLPHRQTRRWEILPPSVLSPVGIDVVTAVCPVGIASVGIARVLWGSHSHKLCWFSGLGVWHPVLTVGVLDVGSKPFALLGEAGSWGFRPHGMAQCQEWGSSQECVSAFPTYFDVGIFSFI